jgi:anthranilate phosphoribosyltransferase
VRRYLEQLVAGHSLSRADARAAFDRIMSGQVEPPVLAALLTALAAKGETVEELVGAALAMKEHARPVQCPAGAIDTCGTGGDGISTFNVSTTAALIAAAAGATVAKHGNRSTTRVSGSAEVLEALGVNIDADVSAVERCLTEVGIGFLFAPALHPGMGHAAPVRRALGVRTIFNLLGPLVNPAGVRRQVIGVPRPELTEKLAAVLKELGSQHVWVVHGSDGLCDLTVTGETRVTELADGKVRTFTVSPADCGLPRGSLDDLKVNGAGASAAAVRGVLAGWAGPRRDHALLNAAAALVVAGLTESLEQGVARAAQAVDSGAAARALDRLIDHSHRGQAPESQPRVRQ